MTDVFAPAIEQDWLNLEVSHGAKELAPTHYGLPDLTHPFASPSLLSLRDAIAALGPLVDQSPHDLRSYDPSLVTLPSDDSSLTDGTDSVLGSLTEQSLVGNLSDSILLAPNRAAAVINRQGEAGTDDALSTALSTGLYSGLSELTINGTIGGTNHLAPDLDVDFYSVSLQAGDRLLIDIDAELLGTSLDSGLRLFDAAGNELAWSDDDQAPGEEFTFDSYLDFTANTTGTYYIGVSGYPNFDYSPLTPYSGSSSSRGDYQLNLTLMPYAREQNDLITQGILTGLSSSNPGQVQFTGVIGDSPNLIPTFDRDFFHVRLDAGDVLTVDIDAFAQGTWLDSVVRVFDANGNEVAFSDDAAAPGETLSYDSYLQFTAQQTGNYYIGISGYGNDLYDPFDLFSGVSGSTGEYTLTLDVAHDLSSDESNDTLTEAIYTGLGPATPGTIEVQGAIGDNPSLASGLDVDMFSVQLNAGDRLIVDVDAHQFGGSLDSGLRIFDALGNELLLSDDNPAPGESFSFDPYLEFTATETGNYYIGLSGYWNYDYNPFLAGSGTPGSTGDYTMIMTVEPGLSTPVTSGFSSIYGYGLVNAAAAVAAAIDEPTFPDQPNLGGNLWGLDRVNAPEAWSQGYTGEGTVVAVLDTGVDWLHPDLSANIWVNQAEVPGNGIDDDNNGFVDDVRGWDFVNNDNTPDDADGHGTHVSGTIAGLNNGFGITGVAYDAAIMPVRVIGDWAEQDEYEYLRAIADGIYYAVDNGAHVINMSLGYDPSWFPGGVLPPEATEVEAALQYASQQGTVVIMAAGNNYSSLPGYPAIHALDWGMAIGAVDEFNQMADFSNYAGSTPLDYVVAPGVDVYSTLPNGNFGVLSGTSMAAPHVAGVAALVMQANPNLTAAEVENILVSTANPAGITV